MKFNVLMAVAVSLGMSAVLQASPFTNGSFESPVYTQAYNDRVDGSTVGSWTASVPPGCYPTVINGPAAGIGAEDGNQIYGFNGGDSAPGGTIYQNFSTVTGLPYLVSFYVARFGGGDGFSAIQASVIGNPFGTQSALGILVGPAVGPWTEYSFSFTAVSSITRLALSDVSTATASVDPLLDNVSVVALPEPTTVVTLLAIGTGVLLKRRNRVVIA